MDPGMVQTLQPRPMTDQSSLSLLGGTVMPWINLTVRRGTFTKDKQHAVMAKLALLTAAD
jgi:hypothetical protein